MATDRKTYTALAAISKLYQNIDKNLAVILWSISVFSRAMERECSSFGMKLIICYSALHRKTGVTGSKRQLTALIWCVTKHFCMLINATFSLDYGKQKP